MLRIFRDTHYQFRDEIHKLYMDNASQGDENRHVDPEELDNEIRLTYQEGMMMVAVDDEVGTDSKLTGALFVYPLQYDARFKPELSDVHDKAHTPYIAEVMINKSYKKSGLGRKMMQKTFSYLKENRFTEVFVKVWKKNVSTFKLYCDVGFGVVEKLFTKKWFDNLKNFLSEGKFYLRRAL